MEQQQQQKHSFAYNSDIQKLTFGYIRQMHDEFESPISICKLSHQYVQC